MPVQIVGYVREGAILFELLEQKANGVCFVGDNDDSRNKPRQAADDSFLPALALVAVWPAKHHPGVGQSLLVGQVTIVLPKGLPGLFKTG